MKQNAKTYKELIAELQKKRLKPGYAERTRLFKEALEKNLHKLGAKKT